MTALFDRAFTRGWSLTRVPRAISSFASSGELLVHHSVVAWLENATYILARTQA